MINFYREELMKLFEDLNKLKIDTKNSSLCCSIQERLIYRIRYIEGKIRTIKKEIQSLNADVKNLRLPREATKKLKQKISEREEKKKSYNYILSVLRDIGDGVAFIYLSKWDIKPLCLGKEPPGFISGKSGLRLELAIFRRISKRGIVCIFNDATNSLRHGDITVPKYGVPFLIEAKSGKSSRYDERSQRQMGKANKILKYLHEDKGEEVYPDQQGIQMQRRTLTIKERDHQRKITSLIEKVTISHRNKLKKIEDGLYYYVAETTDTIDADLNRLPKDGEWCFCSVNEEKEIKRAYYPFTLSIGNAKGLMNFYEGKIIVFVILDIKFLERELVRRGFKVKFLNDDLYFIYIDNPAAEIRHVQISQHFFGRVIAEFLSLKWFIDEICARTHKDEKKTEMNIEEVIRINKVGLNSYQDEKIKKDIEKFLSLIN